MLRLATYKKAKKKSEARRKKKKKQKAKKRDRKSPKKRRKLGESCSRINKKSHITDLGSPGAL
jgi:hypothetical protein